MSADPQTDQVAAAELLRHWLSQRLRETDLRWVDGKRQQIAGGAAERVLFASFSAVPRYTRKGDLGLTQQDLQRARTQRPGWDPSRWSCDQAGRVLLLLSIPAGDAIAHAAALTRLFTSADVGEAVALCLSLPLLPHPERHRILAAEGVRSNMAAVVNAVALRNPFPCNYLDDTAWNQMVLKTVFIGSSLGLVYGIDQRANAKLARMLVDYAHERWSAGRWVTPELWRPVGAYADEGIMADLEKVLADSDPVQQQAAALALSESPARDAKGLLAGRADLRSRIASGQLTWQSIAREVAGTE